MHCILYPNVHSPEDWGLFLKIFIFVITCSLTLAGEIPDSSRVFRLNEIVVSGQRIQSDASILPSPVHIIDSTLIEAVPASSVADLLKALNGVSIRRYGGPGSLQSISIRGLGQDYSLVLIDGQRLTTSQISTVDLGIIPLTTIDRIEVVSGGNSALYGSDAVGGVVNIITKKPSKEASGRVTGSIGSFGLSSYSLFAGEGYKNYSFNGSITRMNASNNYPLHYDDGVVSKTINRIGADYSINAYSFSGSRFDENASQRVMLRFNDAERGQPAALLSPYQKNFARIRDKDFSALFDMHATNHSNWKYSISGMYRNFLETYNDPTIKSDGAYYYLNQIVSINPQFEWTLSEHHTMVFGGEGMFSSLRSNEVSKTRRFQGSLYISTQSTLEYPFEIIWYPSLRYDSFSDVNGGLSPKIGLNIGVLGKSLLRVRASYGKNYRVPTFNDLYWIAGGNPNLQPEHSMSFDIGLTSSIPTYALVEIEANYFSINTSNKIVWQPNASSLWSPKNLSSVSSNGIELQAVVHLWNDDLMISHIHDFTSAKKTSKDFPSDNTENTFLPYTPQEHSVTMIFARSYGFEMTLLHSFSGFRYESQTNDPAYVLPAYHTTDVSIGYLCRFNSWGLKVKADVNNIFNTSYEIISDYPIPLRNYKFTCEILL